MGFGILFVGYLLTFAFSVANVYFFADVAGGLIMALALVKLYPHGKKFGVSAIFASLISAAGLALALVYMLSPQSETLLTVLELVKIASVMAFHITLTLALREIADFTGLPEIKKKAARNLIIGLIYFVANTVITLDIEAIRNLAQYTYFPVMLYGYVWIIINAVLIYNCYMRICLSGDEDMEIKPSRFKIINTVNEKLGGIEDKIVEKKKAEAVEALTAQHKKKKKKK